MTCLGIFEGGEEIVGGLNDAPRDSQLFRCAAEALPACIGQDGYQQEEDESNAQSRQLTRLRDVLPQARVNQVAACAAAQFVIMPCGSSLRKGKAGFGRFTNLSSVSRPKNKAPATGEFRRTPMKNEQTLSKSAMRDRSEERRVGKEC